ncbi:MAG: winged helix-turn-helix transcriptional regulator [Acetatifactor sp.]|nr:winged helix-turn-helix transcriptional regulator [Acetatifactor sp.]
MLHLSSLDEAEKVIKALSASMRMEIMKLIYRTPGLSMNELAQTLGLTNSAISIHVSKLVEAGLVQIETTSGKRGTLKLVSPCHDRLIIDMAPPEEEPHYYQDDIKIGYYTGWNITPTCGLASPDKRIGAQDDVKVFTFPEHFEADILWFGSGYVEYILPNHLQPGQHLRELQISFEISSECPGNNDDYPSDIHFSLNGTPLGIWISPGDYGARRGHICPAWWPPGMNQYGLLKTLSINQEGTFIDGGQKLSDVTIEDLKLDYNSQMTFRFEVPQDTPNCGGCTLFGEHFGDFNQSIRIKTIYDI